MINIQMLNENKVKDWRKISAEIIGALKNDVSMKEETLKDVEGSAVYNPDFNLISSEAELTITLNSSSDVFSVELRNDITANIDISELDSDEIHTFDVEGSWTSNVDENVGYAVQQHTYNASDLKTAELEDNYYNENGRDLAIVKYDISSGNIIGAGGVLNVKAYADSPVVKLTASLTDNSLADKILQINLLKTFGDGSTEVEAIDLTQVASYIDAKANSETSNSVKSVKTEIENVENTTVSPINEVIVNNASGKYGSINIGYTYSGISYSTSAYSSSNNDELTNLSTNELFTSSQFHMNSNALGVNISFAYGTALGSDDIDDWKYYFVYGSDSEYCPNSPYTSYVSNNRQYISSSELPSVGQSKDFYPTVYEYHDLDNNIWKYEEYTGTDIVFTITNIDGTNYTVSFIWHKLGNVQTTVKNFKTTLTRNDDSEVVTTSPISGLLQDVTFDTEEKIGRTLSNSTKIYYYSVGISDGMGEN